jgi:hypothetical protein
MEPQDQQECVSSGRGFVPIAVRDNFVVNSIPRVSPPLVQRKSALNSPVRAHGA